jgi:large subunit ribosomal protein L4
MIDKKIIVKKSLFVTRANVLAKRAEAVAKISLFSFETGEKKSDGVIPDFLNIKVKPALIKQAITAHISYAFQPSHTKTRGEVRGGGRKPWKQKGTGKARQGSIRAPQFIGGGVVFGPQKIGNKVNPISKKMNKKAILGILSNKIANHKMILIDNIELSEAKTKQAYTRVSALAPNTKTLLILATAEKDDTKPFVNIKSLKISLINRLNVYNLLLAKKILMTQKAFEELSQKMSKIKV